MARCYARAGVSSSSLSTVRFCGPSEVAGERKLTPIENNWDFHPRLESSQLQAAPVMSVTLSKLRACDSSTTCSTAGSWTKNVACPSTQLFRGSAENLYGVLRRYILERPGVVMGELDQKDKGTVDGAAGGAAAEVDTAPQTRRWPCFCP